MFCFSFIVPNQSFLAMTDCVRMVRLGCLKCHKHPYMLSKQSSTLKSRNFQVYKIWLPTWHYEVGNLNIPMIKLWLSEKKASLDYSCCVLDVHLTCLSVICATSLFFTVWGDSIIGELLLNDVINECHPLSTECHHIKFITLFNNFMQFCHNGYNILRAFHF